jgi:peptidoglycan/xylan/chitin deacetylase (PgdA/CDA1 family)
MEFRNLVNRAQKIPWLRLWDYFSGNRLRILMYHSINDDPQDSHAISPAKFIKQIETLTARPGAQFICLSQGLERLAASKPATLYNTFIITFDDAYRNFWQTAWPILQAHHIPATLFVPTRCLGGKAVWHSYNKNQFLMDWDEVIEASKQGVEMGSHTAGHVRLTECSDSMIESELDTSLDMLMSKLGTAVIPAIAYPGGYYDHRVINLARKCGYQCGLGASSRWGNGPETNLFMLRREKVQV